MLIGLPILWSVRGKYQTAEVDLAERVCSDEPPLIAGPQPRQLKQQLRSSFGQGSAARHGPQNQRGIGLRPRAQLQTAARTADVDGGAKLHKKSALRAETADGKRQCRGRARLAARGAERLAPGRPAGSSLDRDLTRALRRKPRQSRRMNHLASAVSFLIGK